MGLVRYSLSEHFYLADFVDMKFVNHLKNAINSKPTELQDSYNQLHKAILEYRKTTEELRKNLTNVLQVAIVNIKSENSIRTLILSKFNDYTKNPMTKDQLNKCCPQVYNARSAVADFNEAIDVALDNLAKNIAPEKANVASKIIEYRDKNVESAKIPEMKNNIDELIKLIQSQNQFAIENANKFGTEFQKDIENAAGACEGFLEKAFNEIKQYF